MTNARIASPNDPREWDDWAGSYGADADLLGGLHDDELLRMADFRGKRVLDLGCGTGRFARRIAPLAAKVTAADYSPNMFEAARKNLGVFGNADVRLLDMEKEDVGPDKYDIITAISVMHHVSGLERAVNNMKNSLTGGGKIIIVDHVYTRNPLRLVTFYLAALLKLGPLRCAGIFWGMISGASRMAGHMKREAKMTLADLRNDYRELLPGARVRLGSGIFAYLEWTKPNA